MKTTAKYFIIFMILISFVNIVFAQDEDEVIIKHGPRENKKIAITFDDGPHPKETLEVLDVLKKYNVKATFFVAGKHVNWYTEPLIRASKENHEIGNHTFTHPNITNLSASQLEKEILDCEKILIEKTGKKPTLFRPPYGSYNKEAIINIANKLNYKIVLWTTIDAKDWKNPSAQSIANTVIENIQNGDIILLHDYATEHTVEALDIFIPEMIKRGYEFVTVSELIEK